LPPAVALADGGNNLYEFKQSFAADVTDAVAKPMDPRDRIRGEVGPRAGPPKEPVIVRLQQLQHAVESRFSDQMIARCKLIL
jgi:hypothetical protein